MYLSELAGPQQVAPGGLFWGLCPLQPCLADSSRGIMWGGKMVVSMMVWRGADGSHRRMWTSTSSPRLEGHSVLRGKLSFLPSTANHAEAVGLQLATLPPSFPSSFTHTPHARTSRAHQLPLLCEHYGTLSMGGRLRGGIQGNHGSSRGAPRGIAGEEREVLSTTGPQA